MPCKLQYFVIAVYSCVYLKKHEKQYLFPDHLKDFMVQTCYWAEYYLSVFILKPAWCQSSCKTSLFFNTILWKFFSVILVGHFVKFPFLPGAKIRAVTVSLQYLPNFEKPTSVAALTVSHATAGLMEVSIAAVCVVACMCVYVQRSQPAHFEFCCCCWSNLSQVRMMRSKPPNLKFYATALCTTAIKSQFHESCSFIFRHVSLSAAERERGFMCCSRVDRTPAWTQVNRVKKEHSVMEVRLYFQNEFHGGTPTKDMCLLLSAHPSKNIIPDSHYQGSCCHWEWPEDRLKVLSFLLIKSRPIMH